MDLFCPHCANRVTVPEDKAGQVVNCPLCTKAFQAPALAPPPVAPKPPAPLPAPAAPAAPAAEGTYGLGPEPKPGPSHVLVPPAPTPAAPPPPPPPPLPPGEYTRSLGFGLDAAWLTFVTPTCLIGVFILSFFSWHAEYRTLPGATESVTIKALNLWQLSFTENGQWPFLAYVLLMLVGFPLALLAMLFDRGVIAEPPQIAAGLKFRHLLVGLVLVLAWLLLCVASFYSHLIQTNNPIALAFKFAFRLHFLAVAASFGMFWLAWRKPSNLPPPTFEVRW